MLSARARLTLFATACGLLFPYAQLAASPEFIKLRTQVFQERIVTDADGKRRVQRIPAASVTSGSEVVYEVGYSNTGPKPMQVIITNPLPEDLVYQSYAARSVGAQLEVSVDQGRSFGPLDKLLIAGTDGTKRAATAADITHVRWKTARPIKPGEAGYVSLRARLR
jgi:uncharacterized repeat protein (TIGR01451 family)